MTTPEHAGARALDEALAEALVAVGDGLELAGTLRRILRIAVDLTGARYGALGVVDPRGGLSEFLHAGLTDEAAALIGRLPTGRGLLGELINHHGPLRLPHLAEHPASVGVPPGHPAMDSFLGVGIEAGGQVFGTLYLTEKPGGFDAADEERITALATAAGVAVHNAQLFVAARTGAAWQQAVAQMSRAALLEDGGSVLQALAARSRELAGAGIAVVVTRGEGEFEIEVVDGGGIPDAGAQADAAIEHLTGNDRDVLSECLDRRTPVVLVGESTTVPGWPRVVCVPIAAGERDRGVLVLLCAAAPRARQDSPVDVLAGLAAQAAVSLELDDVRRAKEHLRVYRDRDRIARDLHDLVVQRLFASDMSLQVLQRSTDLPEPARERLERVIGEIDATISQIRGTIFELRDGEGNSWRLAERLRREAELMSDALGGLGAEVDVSAELSALEFDDLVADSVAVVREGLSNAAKHAAPSRVLVSVTAVAGSFTITVTDDGPGPGDSERMSGLANLRDRALSRGGRCELAAIPGGGAALTWSVPLAP